MSDPIEHRVTRLEFRADSHDTAIASLKENDTTMAATLRAIQDNLKQIKWIAMGAAGFFLVGEIGILEILRKFIHL